MIFQHTWEAVLESRKTQTRRLVKPNHHALNVWRTELGSELRIGESGDSNRIGVVQALGRDIYLVGKTYAVQPEYRKRAVARIRILRIRREDVRNISDADVKAEGFVNSARFFDTWIGMHDPKLNEQIGHWFVNRRAAVSAEDAANIYRIQMQDRPAERYEAWALTFEVVK